MYFNSHNKSECCGCGACSQVCPKQCITIVPDEDGFLFPCIDNSRCVHCHLCEKVCPVENVPINLETQGEQWIVAARCKDEDSVKKASSGGAFGAIVRTLRKNKEWMVWGAAFDDNLQVVHQCSKDKNDLTALHKSKYVQSQLMDAFPRIRQQLKNGKNVVFSGTPCQVAALHNYLRDDNIENLFCIDLVCHGVPSQKMFDKYVFEEEKRLNDKIQSVEFRFRVFNKIRKNWNSRNIRLVTKSGKVKILNRYNSIFLRAYHSFLFYRDSCHACRFATSNRQGDLTIGDFWGIQRFYPELDADKGISLIQCNTTKGKRVFEELSGEMTIYSIDREKYLSMTGGAMVAATPKNSRREAFLKYSRTHSLVESIDKYVPKYKEIFKIEIARKISPETRRKIKRLLKR